MTELARLTFDILSHAWRKRDVLLVDLKIEFGRLAGGENQGQLVIADVIDNDSWRIWPQGREELMLDKQIYRNLQTVDDAALEERQASVRARRRPRRDVSGDAARHGRGHRRLTRAGRARERDRHRARAARLADGSARRQPVGDAGLRAAADAAARSQLRAPDRRRRGRERAAALDARCELVGAGARRTQRDASG